jgi:uncharacterized protein (DUF2062 family)
MINRFPRITLTHIINLSKREKFIEYMHKLFSLNSDPKHFAFSVAVGIFIGVFFPMGIQTIVLIPVTILLGSNLFISWVFSFISNPLTIIPIYLFIFKAGEWTTGFYISYEKIDLLINEFSLENIWNLGTEGLIIFATGAFVTALTSAIISYIISHNFMKKYNQKYLSHNSI